MSSVLDTFASRIDHTLLKPEAMAHHIAQICKEAQVYSVASVCVNSTRIAVAREALGGSTIPICTVIGFPLGACLTGSKVAEVRAARAAGASEFDMVINVGALKDGDLAAVVSDILAVREASAGHILKVIIESSVLTPTEIRSACDAAVQAGADFVKTSTGFHPTGGATLDAVRIIRAAVGSAAQVKASGGIRDLATANAMIDAGADRLGLGGTVAILNELAARTA